MRGVRLPALVPAVAIVLVCGSALVAGPQKERLPIGEFTARKIDPPVVDGKIGAGEWDRAFTTSGMITPFGHDLHQAETTVALGFDEANLYFLFKCRRTDREWYLRKSVRENDGYSFGDPSVEIWVTPPKLVPETYQNIINTFPAVLDQKMIPTRGYVAQGWSGRWTLGVTETETHYVLEAAIAAADFGIQKVEDGATWRFLLCRTAQGAKPRAQASWSVTQGFSEIPQHPQVHLRHDEAVVQLYGVTSVFTGQHRFPMAVVAPEAGPAEVSVELRWHAEPSGEKPLHVESRTLELDAGERKTFEFAGAVPEPLRDSKEKGYFTLVAMRKNGTEIYRQSFPFVVNGWTPSPRPHKPPDAKPPAELEFQAMYGPESNVMIVRADIIDLPQREKVAGGTIRLLRADGGKELLTVPMGPFRHWYSNTHFFLDKLRVPVLDVAKADKVEEHNERVRKLNEERKKQGKKPEPLWKVPTAEPLKVVVEATVAGADGESIKTKSREVELLRKKFAWSDNSIGITDQVIPPWTPVTYKDGRVGVWNRTLELDGLGLLESIDNGGIDQVRSMRLLVTRDGEASEVEPSEPALLRHVDAQVDLEGSGRCAGLAVDARTRVEFDGFVLNEWTLRGGAEKLTVEVVLPEEEATHFCSTAGGWAAVHDVTPDYWSSQQTGSGVLIGDFVPYIWLTNSDRAFLWVADNDKGWVTDDDRSLPTQEIRREGDTVVLRIHFIELPAELSEPTTITWAYQTFPSRPLPPGWRSIICSGRKGLLPSARNTYFWYDRQADWAVLWPYYCSPYPWSLEKSREAFRRFLPRTDHRPMVGSIAHSIARYRDYQGHQFPNYVVDWGMTPGDRSNGNCTQGKGPIDFRVYHYRMWVRDAGFRGLYVDENYIGLDRNFLTGGAYIRPDGRLQPGYSYLGLREYFKRLRVMFYENKVPAPNLWQHISSGAAYHAWLGHIFFEGENVEPTDLEFDYIEVLPAGRMRAIGSAKCAGGVMTMMCQSQRHATVHEPKHTHQFVGWVMAHDIVPEQVGFYSVIAQEARLYEDDVEFFGYWKDDCPVSTPTPDCLVSAHRSPGRALLWVVNTAREDRTAEVRVDYGDLGLRRRRAVALNAETGESIELSRRGLSVPVLRRDFAAVHLVERRVLESEESFYASFDGRREADEALGCCVLEPAGRDATLALADGVEGQALLVGQGMELWPRLHLTDAEGRVTFQALLSEEGLGPILASTPKRARRGGSPGVPPIAISLEKEGLVFERLPSKRGAEDGQRIVAPRPGGGETGQRPEGWHAFDLAWKEGSATLTVDGQELGAIRIEGLNIGGGRGAALTEACRFVFGGKGDALVAIDELRCYRPVRRYSGWW
ncbi:MAG: glycoside hydrolase domain-containing protein [Candidatus Brocadiia bacterium]